LKDSDLETRGVVHSEVFFVRISTIVNFSDISFRSN